jgi:hypothetical protein
MNEMPHFTRLEQAALDEICKHSRERPALEGQLATARVSGRKNTGDGFFTYFEVDRNGPPLTSPWRVLGNVAVTIEGFERPLLVTLFRSKDGYAHMLEATTAGDSTVGIDLSAVRFEIVHYFEDVGIAAGRIWDGKNQPSRDCRARDDKSSKI